MFTWECPTCGRELDVGTTECPDCHPESAEKPARRREEPKASPAVAATPAPQSPPKEQPGAGASQPAPRAAAKPSQGPRRTAKSRTGLQPARLRIVAIVLVAAIGLAIYFARPDFFRQAADLTESLPGAGASGGSVVEGTLQVAGIRTFYDNEYRPRVRAVVINHGETPLSNVELVVQMRPPRAPSTSAPLASFVIQLDEIGAQASQEVETELAALGTLASLPPWGEIRLTLTTPGSAAPEAPASSRL